MSKRSIVLVAGAIAAIASLTVGSAASAKSESSAAGTVVMVHDQEPGIINPYLSTGNGYVNQLTIGPMLASGAIYNQKAQARPVPDGVRPQARQGRAAHRHRQVQAERGLERRQADHGQRSRRHVADDHEPELGHHVARGLGGHSAHRCQGEELHRDLQAEAGVCRVGRAHRQHQRHACAQGDGRRLQQALAGLDRHRQRPVQVPELAARHADDAREEPGFKAGASAKLDRIVFRFIAGASEFQALQSGEADVMEPQPQVQIVDFYKNSKFKVQAGQGYQWEHLDFQQGAKAHPALKKKYVRQAIITGINRSQLREVLYVKSGLVTSNKLMPVLQSHIYKPFEAAYKPAYARWKFSQRNAIALLKKNGCTGGPDTPSSATARSSAAPASVSCRSRSRRPRATRFVLSRSRSSRGSSRASASSSRRGSSTRPCSSEAAC